MGQNTRAGKSLKKWNNSIKWSNSQIVMEWQACKQQKPLNPYIGIYITQSLALS